MLKVAVFSAKPYDKEFLTQTKAENLSWSFFECSLDLNTKEMAREHDAICIFVNDHVCKECLEILHQYGVKLIVLRCTGYNNVDVEAAKKLGITVTRCPAYSPYSVAEHAVGLLLSLNRKIHLAHDRVHNHNFTINGLLGFDIKGKTVGVIGTGHIGKAFAQIMRGFGAKVIAFDIAPDEYWANIYQVIYQDSVEKIFQKSDVISLHVPLVSETSYMINDEAISKMKKGVYIINTARGKVIDTEALIRGVEKGIIGGAALDTYENEAGIFYHDFSGEKLKDELLLRLLALPNVLVTAHQGYFTQEAMDEISYTTVENLRRFEESQALLEGTVL